MCRYVVIDTETTGLNTQADRVVEVGCVELINSVVTGSYFHSFVNPSQPNSPEAFAVHGLSDVFLGEQPTFSLVAAKFLSFVSGSCLVVHNAAFDVNFIDRELASIGQPTVMRFVRGLVDTYERAKALFAGKRNSLDALCDRLKVRRTDRVKHGALVDAQLLARLFLVIRDQGVPIWKRFASRRVAQDKHKRWDNLPAISATQSEEVQHKATLQALDNMTCGGCVWLGGFARVPGVLL